MFGKKKKTTDPAKEAAKDNAPASKPALPPFEQVRLPEMPQAKPVTKPVSWHAKRKFYHVFNDKSTGRRVAFSALLVYAPTAMLVNVYDRDPSSERAPGGAEQVQKYATEVDQLARAFRGAEATSANLPKATDADIERLRSLNARGAELAARITMDNHISEQDARELARRFEGQTSSNLSVTRHFERIDDGAPSLAEARGRLSQDPAFSRADDAGKAQAVQAEANSSTFWNYWTSFLIVYFVFFNMFDRNLKNQLAKGRRKDDDFIHEEIKDKIDSEKDVLKELLKPSAPKDAPKPPKA